MRFQVIDVDATPKMGKNNKPYDVCEVTYKDQENKVKAYKVMAFKDKPMYETVKALKKNDVIDVQMIKTDAGYWDWTEVTVGNTAAQPAKAASGASSASEKPYFTPDADRQEMIIRQTALKAAVDFHVGTKDGYTEMDVLDTAGVFVQFVYKQVDPTANTDVDSDVPY